ncbi:hypothetical protein H0N99_02500 [Candidatus Micrarchaeota archaeon]|nr:hypothetical protein [Candidatus Micrarchaeota archaeon]
MGVPVAFQNIWTIWQVVAVGAAVLSILFASLAYLLAHLFRLKEIEVWSKEEVYQALASAFIIAVAVVVVTAIVNFSCSLTDGCPPGGDHISVAINIMDNMKNKSVEQTQEIFGLAMRVGLIKSMGKYYDFSIGPGSETCLLGYCPTAFGFRWDMWAGGSVISDSLDYAFSILLPLVSSFFAQLWMLRFIQATLFPSLLALGIILRTFFFTRKVGGLLIAIALGLYTIYPLMYIMLGSYMDFNVRKLYYPSNDPTHWYAPISCAGGGFMPGGADSNAPYCISFLGMMSYIIPGLPTAVGNFGAADFMFKNGCVAADPNVCPGSSCPSTPGFCSPAPDVYAGMRSQYDGVLPTIGYLMVPAVFIPLIILLVTISFIRTLSPMLGGDVEIAGLTRIL